MKLQALLTITLCSQLLRYYQHLGELLGDLIITTFGSSAGVREMFLLKALESNSSDQVLSALRPKELKNGEEESFSL